MPKIDTLLLRLALFLFVGVCLSAPAMATDHLGSSCVADDWRFDSRGGKRVFVYVLKNSCDVGFRCVASTNISTPEGTTLGRAVIRVEKGSAEEPTVVSHAFRMKGGATHSIQASKRCAKT